MLFIWKVGFLAVYHIVTLRYTGVFLEMISRGEMSNVKLISDSYNSLFHFVGLYVKRTTSKLKIFENVIYLFNRNSEIFSFNIE